MIKAIWYNYNKIKIYKYSDMTKPTSFDVWGTSFEVWVQTNSCTWEQGEMLSGLIYFCLPHLTYFPTTEGRLESILPCFSLRTKHYSVLQGNLGPSSHSTVACLQIKEIFIQENNSQHSFSSCMNLFFFPSLHTPHTHSPTQTVLVT